MSRTKNALKIVMASALQQVVVVLAGIILPPLIIAEYGSEANGLINTVKQMLTYFSVVSLGLGASCQVALFKPLAEDDYDAINPILSATRIFFNRTGYVFGLLVSAGAFLLPLFTTSSWTYFDIVIVVLITGIGSLCEYILISKYKILLVADQKQYVTASIQMQGTIINTVLSVVLILLHANIIFVQVVSTFAYVVRLLFAIRYVKKHYPKANFKVSPNFDAISDRWDAFGTQISDMIINYTPMIMVATLISLADASIYSVYNMVFSSMTMIVAVFSSGFAPSFGNVMAKEDQKTLQKTFSTFNFVYRVISFIVYTCALVLILGFVSVYIKNSDGVNYILPNVAIAFTFSSLFKAIRTPSVTLVNAAGKFKDNRNANLIEAGSNILLSIILILRFGMVGMLIASSITGLCRSILFVLYNHKKILGDKPTKDILSLVLNFVLMIGIFMLVPKVMCNSWSEWIIQALIVAPIVLVAFVLLNVILEPAAAKDMAKRIKQLVSRR